MLGPGHTACAVRDHQTVLYIMEDIKYIIESLLFVAEGPLTLDRIRKTLTLADTKAIRGAKEIANTNLNRFQNQTFISDAASYPKRTKYIVSRNEL